MIVGSGTSSEWNRYTDVISGETSGSDVKCRLFSWATKVHNEILEAKCFLNRKVTFAFKRTKSTAFPIIQ